MLMRVVVVKLDFFSNCTMNGGHFWNAGHGVKRCKMLSHL